MQTFPASTAASANLAPGTSQPFKYPLERQFVEPDWTRIPGYRSVTKAEWETALWQRKHTIKNSYTHLNKNSNKNNNDSNNSSRSNDDDDSNNH